MHLPFRRLAAVAAATVAVAGAGVLTASPASAGTNCESGYHCVFFTGLTSAQQRFYTSDPDFTDDYFWYINLPVNDRVSSASNSSTGGYASYYWQNAQWQGYGKLLFCVKPGHQVTASQLTDDGIPGNGQGQRNEASALTLVSNYSSTCF